MGAIENLYKDEYRVVSEFKKKGDFQMKLNLYFPLF